MSSAGQPGLGVRGAAPNCSHGCRVGSKEPTSDGSYTMNHTAMVYLMDRDGKFTGIVSYGEKPEMRLNKLRKLLAS